MQKNQLTRIESLALSITKWVGSVQSIVIHTGVFVACFAAVWFNLLPFDRMLLVLTTILSIEAVYLALFIQLTVNAQAKSLEEVEHGIEEIQEDIDEIQEDVGEIQEDVGEIQEDVDELQEDIDELQEDVEEMNEDEKEEEAREEDQRRTLNEVRSNLEKLMQDLEKLQKRGKGE